MSRLSVPEAVEVLLAERGDALGVVTMSALGWWDTREDDLRLLGWMGAAGSIGLGIALGAPDREVWVVDGDGSLLMQLGVLPAIGATAPPNLTHVVLDNGVYAVSGAQPTPAPASWPALLRAAGFPDVREAGTADELRAALAGRAAGPRGVVVRCRGERPEYPHGMLAFSAAGEARRVRAALAR